MSDNVTKLPGADMAYHGPTGDMTAFIKRSHMKSIQAMLWMQMSLEKLISDNRYNVSTQQLIDLLNTIRETPHDDLMKRQPGDFL